MNNLSRVWNCRRCGRENRTDVRPDGTVLCEHCGDVKSIQPARRRSGQTSTENPEVPAHQDRTDETSMSGSGECFQRDDSERRDAFVRLQESYGEAQKHVPKEGTYEELEWILGARRNGTQDPLSLGTKTIELIALWLQDLVREMERRSPAGTEAERSLRDATAGFLQMFRRDPADAPREAGGAGGAARYEEPGTWNLEPNAAAGSRR